MSHSLRMIRATLVAGVLLAAASGCDDGKPAVATTTEEATVAGSVTINGKKASGGTITFNPANYKRKVGSRTAPIEKDGTYSIKTLQGENRVKVSAPSLNLSRALDGMEFSYDVKTEANTYDIVLPPP